MSARRRDPTPRRLLAGAVLVPLVAVAAVALLRDRDRADAVAPSTTLARDDGGVDAAAAAEADADRVPPRSIAFAADAGAGAALTAPVDHQRVETVPEPMDIYVTRAGEPIQPLVSSDAHERCPTFSPDGRRLAHLAVRSGPPPGSYPETGPPLDATLVVHRLDGSTAPTEPELVVDFPAATGYAVRREIGYPCPRWSPDGNRLAFLAQPVAPAGARSDVAEVRVVTLDGREQVVDGGTAADLRSPLAWSPAGDAIAYVRDDGVWAATLDGRDPSLLWQPDGTPTAVSWSALGELAVTVEALVPEDGPQVHVVDVGSGAATLVDAVGGCGGWARWSADGSRLAFVRSDGQIALHDRRDRSTVSLPPPVVEGGQVGVCDVAWSPDGQQLLALAWAVDPRFAAEDPAAFVVSSGMALLSLSDDGSLVDVLTPWTWAFDWIDLRDVSPAPA